MKKIWNTKTRSNYITYAFILILYLVAQIMLKTGSMSNLIEGLLVPLCVYAIMAVSLNLTVGISGELSLGHAGFMCVGAFSGALFSKIMQNAIPIGLLRFAIALLVGTMLAGAFGFLVGIPVLRLRGDYLAIVTLAFGEIIKNIVNALFIGRDSRGFHFSLKDTLSLGLEPDGEVLIKGPQGITGTPKDATFTIGIILLFISVFVILRLIQTRDGRAIMAIRDNRIAAESVGLNITKYKLLAFSISAGLAGMAGVLLAHNIAILDAQKRFSYDTSILILIFVVLGGIGNIRGSVIAAIVLTLLPELLRGISDYRMLVYAIILIVMMLFNWAPKARELREMYSPFKKKEKQTIQKEAK